MLQITPEPTNGVQVCRVTGRVDSTTSPEAEKKLEAIQAENPGETLVLDLAGVEFLSSAGLRVILMTAKRAKATGADLLLSSPTESVEQVLRISGFHSIVGIHPDLESALQKAQS